MNGDAKRSEFFSGKKNEIENGVLLHAKGAIHLNSAMIYDDKILSTFHDFIQKSHNYMIGYSPKINIIDYKISNGKVIMDLQIAAENISIDIEPPAHLEAKIEDGRLFLQDDKKQKFTLPVQVITDRVRNCGLDFNFIVKYVGQAYGGEGSRNSIERLKKHETLQKIAVIGVPEHHNLDIILLSIENSSQLITAMNPFADDRTQSDERIEAGISTMRNFDMKDKVTLFEAAFIRYFRPEFNEIFKDSFPSTNHSALKNCYEKDFSYLCAEIWVDELPAYLCSEQIKPKYAHIAEYNLHSDESRNAFFLHSN